MGGLFGAFGDEEGIDIEAGEGFTVVSSAFAALDFEGDFVEKLVREY